MIRNHRLFLLLIPIVIISQLYLLAPHLQYGLSDLDDGSIYGFKRYVKQSPNIISFFVESYKELGVYTHQYYYLGLLNYFFQDNFASYHQVTHIFKILTTLGAYPLFYVLSGSSAVAFVSVLIFAFSHSAAGSIQLAVTGSDYPAMLMLEIFLWFYFYMVKNKIDRISLILTALIFFGTALVFSTERVYPVIFLILIIEIIRLLKDKSQIFVALKRVLILFSPIFLAILIAPVFLGLLIPNSAGLVQSLINGRLDHLLVPVIALTSTILPHKFWNLISVTQTDSFTNFIMSLVTGILPLLFIFTALLGRILSKKPLRFNLIIILATFFGIIITYFFAMRHSGVYVGPAFLGFYILGLAIAFLFEWIESKDKYYFGLFFGPLVAFFFIFNMWFATMDRDLVFHGVHRYITVASIFISLFSGTLIVVLYRAFFRHKIFSMIAPFLPAVIMVSLIYFSVVELQYYFNYDLTYGYGNQDKVFMRRQLWPYMTKLSSENPTLFYFDIYTDSGNSFYYENTITSGFDTWTLWLPNVNFKRELTPYFIADFKLLKSSIAFKDDRKVIFYNNTVYQPDNFYAFQFINKEAFNITNKIKKELGI